MSREVHAIPPAPRRVRWRSIFGYRWPLALAAFLLGLYAGLWTWMLFLNQRLGQERLEQSDQRIEAQAEIIAVDRAGRMDDGSPAERVWFRFEHQGMTQTQRSFAPVGRYAVGSTETIQLITGNPEFSCLLDAQMEPSLFWIDPRSWFAVLVVPGLIAFVMWLSGVLRLYRILTHGDVGVAEIISVQAVRWVLPETWSVRFQFRDHQATVRRSRHWVRVHGDLGYRLRGFDPLAERPMRVPVLHDRRWPQHCRLVVGGDLPDAARDATAADLRN